MRLQLTGSRNGENEEMRLDFLEGPDQTVANNASFHMLHTCTTELRFSELC